MPNKHRFLIVGSSALGEALNVALRGAGHDAGVCKDATQAVALARQYHPTAVVVLTDLDTYPGQELVARLNLEGATGGLPVVAVSPSAQTRVALSAIGAGVSGVIVGALAPDILVVGLTSIVGPHPKDPRARAALDRSGPATLRRFAAFAREASIDATIAITGAPASAEVTFKGGAFFDGRFGNESGHAAAQALLNVKNAGPWSFALVAGGATDGGHAVARTAPAVKAAIPFSADPDDDISVDLDIDLDLPPELPAPAPAALESLAKLKVVLADDDPSLLGMYDAVFKKQGWEVHTAPNWRDAYALALSVRPDVIVSDIMMPETDGWGFLGLVRSDFRLRETPFLLLSCHTDFLGKLEKLEAGADDYLEKGLRPSQVVQNVNRVVSRRRNLSASLRVPASFSGQVGSVGPAFLIERLARARASGRLEAIHGLGSYRIRFAEGRIVDAVLDAGDPVQSGEAVLHNFLCVDDAPFVFTVAEPTPGPLDIEYLAQREAIAGVLNQTRVVNDEQLFGTNHPLVVEKRDLGDLYLALASQVTRPVVSAILGGTPPRELLATSDASPLLIEAVVKDLLRKGIARFA